MSRAKTKSVSVDGIKHAMAPEHVELRACKDGNDQRQYKIRDIEKFDAISLEIAHCAAFMGRNESLQFMAGVAKAGYRQFGEEWLADVRRWIEAVDLQ